MTAKVTKIEAQKRPGRYNIYLDGRYAFPISESVLIKFRVFKGMPIDGDLQQQMMTADDVARAYSRALDYLSHQLRSAKEVRQRLAADEIPEEIIDTTLAKLIDDRLVDDQVYAHSYVRTAKNTTDKGPRVIAQQLRQRGIANDLIEAALGDYPRDERLETGTRIAAKLVQHYRRDAFSVMKQKVRQSLYQKGFASDEAAIMIDRLALVVDDATQRELLDQQATKLWRRYRALPDVQRTQKVRQALYRKGFSADTITEWLSHHGSAAQDL